MMRLVDKSKLSAFRFIYLFVLVLYAGMSTVFARSLGDVRTVGNGFMLLFTTIFVVVNKINFSRNFLFSIFLFLLYAAVTSFINGLVNPLWISQWLIWLTIAYCVVYVFGKRLFVSYETILMYLCLLSLPLWIVYIFFPDFLRYMMAVLEFSKPFSDGCNVGCNIIFYTIPSSDFVDNEFILIPRNSGFAWEPGAFSSYICLAIYCNILRTDFRIKKNVPLYVLCITLLSTQSTTGLICLIVLIISWLVVKRKFLPVLFSVPVVIGLFNIPFVKDKLFFEYNNLQYLSLSDFGDGNYALGRMYSLKLDMQEFVRHPIFGLGGYVEGTWMYKSGYGNISTISGVGKLLSQYGLLMTLLFAWLIFRSSKRISIIFSNKNGYALIVLFIAIMFSYNIWVHPLLMSFYLFDVYEKKIRRKKMSSKMTIKYILLKKVNQKTLKCNTI